MIGFNTQSAEQQYREQSKNLAKGPAVFSLQYTCQSCGQRKNARDGRKQVVPGAPKHGFRCMECHAKRGAK